MASSFTFVHTADLHLDLPVKGWKEPEKLMERRRDYRSTFRRIVDLARDRKAAFLLIAGDFLEHGYVDRSTLDFVMDQLNRIPGTGVWVAPGNHDPYRADSVYRTVKWPDHVHFFSEQWEDHYFAEYDLRLYGKGFADSWERDPSLPEVRGDGERRLMAVHGTLMDQLEPDDYFPIGVEELAAMEMDYVALGHIHRASTRRLGNGRNTLVRYPGSPEALNWKETGERTVSLVTVDEDGFRLESVPIHSRLYEIEEIEVEGCETNGQVAARIAGRIREEDRKDCRRFVLTGTRSPESEFSPSEITDQLKAEGFFYVECVDRTVPGFDLDQLRAADGVVGAFVRRMEAKIESAPRDEKDLLEEAFHKGLTLLMAEVGQG
ncbi:DNA repair exonuclease SbcCD nuclease subunit [Melghirimyces profundicolus]|uniref:DNA repair exonuclease SbcCD nuclease subunit n=1 Tax=Melghirimyces profundicolus TaxID=1242148 RepID=A0A2T6C807_9BACL|nr:DNA repair exonuclease [Melghirimyces profundicolus]PTX64423.1 DNA repair exonuclease SbcCD nuclease subunit [Melghirimyces profundicolus]